MKTTVLRLLSLTALSLIAGNSFSTTPALPVTVEEKVAYVCEALKVDCSVLDHLPQVVITPFETGPLGFYDPSMPDVVFINSVIWNEEIRVFVPMDPALQSQIAVHELTHWLDAHLNLTGWISGEASVCDSEALAYAVSNLYALEFGGDLRWDWVQFYGHCQ